MGKQKKTRKYSVMKRLISKKHPQIEKNRLKLKAKNRERAKKQVRNIQQIPTSMFFSHNTALGPPYHVLIDTNFINFSIRKKMDIVQGMTDCLLAKCIPVVLESVIAELEALGPRYRIALRLAKDPRFKRFKSSLQKGHYADDDIVEFCRIHRCFIVATCDKDLKRRIRKIPGVPIMSIKGHKYTIERMPELNL